MRFISKYRKSDHFSHLNVFEHGRKIKQNKLRRKTNGSSVDSNEECCYGRSLSSVATTTSYGSGRNTRSQSSTNGIGNYGYEEDDDDDEENRIRIKFTRKFTYQYKSFCCVLSSLLLSLLSAIVVFYIGYNYVKVEPGEELSFQGSFTFTHAGSSLANLSSELSIANYVGAIENAILVHPILRLSFLSAEILALDTETDDTNATIHFGIKFNPRLLLGASLKDMVEVLKQNLRISNGQVDANSITVREFLPSTAVTAPSFLMESSTSNRILEDSLTKNAGRCVTAMQLPFCLNITESTLTAYPNILMHKNKDEVTDDLIIFRELIDGECYEYAAEFLCSVLQPKCLQRPSLPADETKLPCRASCREFWTGCGDRLSERLKKSLDCFKFPEYSDFGRKCRPQPNCDPATMKNDEAFAYRLCDGVVDCDHLEDEMSCPYCNAPDVLHCGLGKKCVPKSSHCDDISDCPDGSDEKNCLSLQPNVTFDLNYKTVLDTLNFKEGYAVYTKNGTTANICVDDENIDDTFTGPILNKIGESLCKNSAYQNVHRVETKSITSGNTPSSKMYAQLQYQHNADVSFLLTSNCSSNRLLYVGCADIECGIQTTRNYISIEGLNKIAKAGDWPWHAALFKDGVHACDATLVSEYWLLTTMSCFQGQNKAEWIAKLGTVRLYAKSPWQQERHIVGMIKSPVEGSTLVLIKLSNPVIFSHFVRPICLPSGSSVSDDLMYCNTLGWTRSREMLQRIEVRENAMDNCADISITSGNTLCAGSTFDPSECNEEEMAGSAMICLTSKQNRWILVGVSSWRISCTPIGMQRPRLYDKVNPNINWIQTVIQET